MKTTVSLLAALALSAIGATDDCDSTGTCLTPCAGLAATTTPAAEKNATPPAPAKPEPKPTTERKRETRRPRPEQWFL